MSWWSTFFSSFIDHLVDSFKIGNIGEEINESILQWQHDFFDVGNFKVVLTDAVIVTWISVLIMFILFKILAWKPKLVPSSKQNVVEAVVSLIISTAEGFGLTKEEAFHITPMIGTIGMMIIGCNIISFFKISPPAKNIAFPVALAFIAIIYVIYASIRFVGLKGFLKSLLSPMPAMLPFKVLDYIIKPMSLALRLFGNVFGAFVFMEFVSIILPVVIPGLLGLWFDLADGILQAIVFTYLTMSYIGEGVEIGHELREHEKKLQEKQDKEQNINNELVI